MHRRLITAAARAAAVTGAAALGLGCAQVALAAPPSSTVAVPCHAADLSSAISRATSGQTLRLAVGRTYVLTTSLPDITTDVNIVGRNTTLRRAGDTPDFTILTVDGGGDLKTSDVNFQNNDDSNADGSDLAIDDGTAAVSGGTFSDSTSGYQGGAIYNGGSLSVSYATFTGNSSEEGGAIYNTDYAQIADSTFTGNDSDYFAGALYNQDEMTVTGSTFTKNGAEYGAGFYNNYQATLASDTFTQNDAYAGGGMQNEGDATVSRSTFSKNRADYGGGIYNYTGTLTAGHSLLEYNKAYDGGGGIYNADGGTVTVQTIEITSNSPDNCEPIGAVTGC